MRALLALLLVAAAGAALYFALGVDKEPIQDAAQRQDNPTKVDPQDPKTHTDLASDGNEREDATKPEPPPGQTPLNPRASATTNKWNNRLQGRVVAPDGEKSVAGALVTLTLYPASEWAVPSADERVPDRVVKSGPDGSFGFDDLDPDEDYTVIAYEPKVGRRSEGNLRVAMGDTDELTVVLQPGARVFGAVTDTGGVAVAGADLTLELVSLGGGAAGTQFKTTSGDAGEFAFLNMGTGNYSLSAWKDGFGRAKIAALNVSGDEVEQNVVLSIAYLIEGRVVAGDGTPIPGAQVEAFGQRGGTGHSFTTANEEGRFSFDDIAEGTYSIQASSMGYKNGRTPRIETGDLNVEVVLEPMPAISGRVLDPAGGPLREFTVRLRARMRGSDQTIPVQRASYKVRDAEQGEYLLPCPREGEYMVEVVHPLYAPSFSEMVTVQKTGTIENVVVHMTAGGILLGKVVDSEGEPVAGARLRTHDTEYVADDPFWQDVGFPSDASQTEASTSADGTFQIKNLAAATYQIRITHGDHASLTLRGLDVTEGARVDTGEIALAAGAELSGTVTKFGQPVSGAKVELQFDAQAAGGGFMERYSTRSDAQGKYALSHVPEGPYRAYAIDPDKDEVLGGLAVGVTPRSILLVEGIKSTENFIIE